MRMNRTVGIVIAVAIVIVVAIMFWPAAVEEDAGPLPIDQTMPDEAAGIDTDPAIEADDVDPAPVGAELEDNPYGPE